MELNPEMKFAFAAIALGLIFIIISYVAHENTEFLENYIKDDFRGVLFYLAILIVSAIIAPVDVLFLMPIATSTWGWKLAGLYSLIGWTLGSAVVFFLTRRFGVPLIRKHSLLQKIYRYEKMMPQKNLFFGIISLRIAIPIDLISYAIGLFTNIKFLPFFFATLIGFIPMAFFMAFLGSLPVLMQVLGLSFFVIVAYYSIVRKKKKLEKENVKKNQGKKH